MARPTKYEKALEEDRRAKISISRHLKQLTDIQEKLQDNYENMSTAQVGALRLQSDISLKLLGKRLPDLKAVDMDVEGDLEHDHNINVTFPDVSSTE